MKHFIETWIAPMGLIAIVLVIGAIVFGCTTATATDTKTDQTVIDIGPRLEKIEAELKPALEALKATKEWGAYIKAKNLLQAADKKVTATKAWKKYSSLTTERAYLLGIKKDGEK